MWTGGRLYNIYVRDIDSGSVVNTIETDDWRVRALLPVGSSVWAGTDSGVIIVINTHTKRIDKELRRHVGGVTVLTSDPSGCGAIVFSGGGDFTMCSWSIDGTLLHVFSGHSSTIRCIFGAVASRAVA